MLHDPKTIKSHEADPNVFTKTVTETFRVEHAHSPAALSLHSSLGFFRYGQLCPVSFPLSLLHISIFLTAAPEDFMAMPPAQDSIFLCWKHTATITRSVHSVPPSTPHLLQLPAVSLQRGQKFHRHRSGIMWFRILTQFPRWTTTKYTSRGFWVTYYPEHPSNRFPSNSSKHIWGQPLRYPLRHHATQDEDTPRVV